MISAPINTELIERNGTTFVKLTYTCMWCSQPVQVEVPFLEYVSWNLAGTLIQNAFPTTSPADREVLMTGSHAKCWDEGMKEPSEDAIERPECDHEGVECNDMNCPCKCDDCPVEDDS